MSEDKAEIETPVRIGVAIKDETANDPICRLCKKPMLPRQERRLMKSREEDYEIHMSCYIEALATATGPYLQTGRRKKTSGSSVVRGGYRRWRY